MARYIVSPRTPPGFLYPATERDLREMFGVTGHQWPKEGCPLRFIQGVAVHVLPADHLSLNKRPGVKSSKHRCIAACPNCGKAVSAGRLQQHKCPPKQEPRHEHGGPQDWPPGFDDDGWGAQS